MPDSNKHASVLNIPIDWAAFLKTCFYRLILNPSPKAKVIKSF